MELHERVKYLRKEILHMSQTEFAYDLGTKRDVINNIEGKRLKRIEQKLPLLNLMCEKYGINKQWLIDGKGSPERYEEDEASAYIAELLLDTDDTLRVLITSIMKTYLSLDEKNKKLLKDFVRKLTENMKESQD